LVCIQERWGINDQIKKTSSDISQLCGVSVVVPDLYRSKIAYEAAKATHLMEGLDWPGAMSDVQAAADCLKKEGCTKVGVVGFCMGDALSLGAGVQHANIDAVIAFYGWNNGLGDAAKMKLPT